MKSTINKLSIDLINKIAAGEVIQRPSSVIKELVENSIDAKSNEIRLSVKDFGKTLIEISDNGIGMNEKDLKLCFLKHTTSKISKSSDLFTLSTNGFRGEAISSISSVARKSFKMLIESLDKNDLNKGVLKHPLVGRINMKMTLDFLFYHFKNHKKIIHKLDKNITNGF